MQIRWISPKNIKVLHQYLPSEKTASEKYRLLMKTNIPLMSVYECENQYLLFKGVDAYNVLSVMNKHKTFPCCIVPYNISKIDWCCTVLRACFQENVYYKVAYDYIMFALDKTHNDVEQIAEEVGCPESKIKKYMIDKRVPDHYKDLAFKHSRHNIVNDICRDSKLSLYENLLYEAAFLSKRRLTQEKLKVFKSYINSGYSINLNGSNPIKELINVVDQEQAWRFYWEYLNNRYDFNKKGINKRKSNNILVRFNDHKRK